VIMEDYFQKVMARINPSPKVLLTRDDIETINIIMKSYFNQYRIDRKYLNDSIYSIKQFLDFKSDIKMSGFNDALRWIKAEHDFQGDLRSLINVREVWTDQNGIEYVLQGADVREKEFKDLQVSHVGELLDLSCVIPTDQGRNIRFSVSAITFADVEVGWYIKDGKIACTEADRYELKILKDIRHRLVDKTALTVSEPLDPREIYFVSPKRNGIKRWLFAFGDKAYLLDGKGDLLSKFDLTTPGHFLILVEVIDDVIFMIDILLYQDRNMIAMSLVNRLSFIQHIEQDYKLLGFELVMQTFYELNMLNETQIATIATTAQEGVVFTSAGYYSAPVIKYKRCDTIDVLLEWRDTHYYGKVVDIELESPNKYMGKNVVCEYKVDFKSGVYVFTYERLRLDRLKPNSDEVVHTILGKARRGSFSYHLLCVYVRMYIRSRFYSGVSSVRPVRNHSQWIEQVNSIINEYKKVGWCTEEDAVRLRNKRLDKAQLRQMAGSLGKMEEFLFNVLNEQG